MKAYLKPSSRTDLVQGEPVLCVLKQDAKQPRGIKVTVGPSAVRQALLTSNELPGLVAGQRASVTVKESTSRGLRVDWDGVQAVIHAHHLLDAGSKGIKTTYPEGTQLQARIIYMNVPAKIVVMSTLENTVELANVQLPVVIGQTFEKCRVVQVATGVGCLLELTNDDNDDSNTTPTQLGFAHISRLTDDHLKSINKTYGTNTIHRARVVALQLMENLAAVSLQESILKQAFLRPHVHLFVLSTAVVS